MTQQVRVGEKVNDEGMQGLFEVLGLVVLDRINAAHGGHMVIEAEVTRFEEKEDAITYSRGRVSQRVANPGGQPAGATHQSAQVLAMKRRDVLTNIEIGEGDVEAAECYGGKPAGTSTRYVVEAQWYADSWQKLLATPDNYEEARRLFITAREVLSHVAGGSNVEVRIVETVWDDSTLTPVSEKILENPLD